jgi:hypothetical protein
MANKEKAWSYGDLSPVARENCKDQFMSVMCPYDSDGMENDTETDWEINVNAWIGDQFWIDQDGNWYDEGRKVRV